LVLLRDLVVDYDALLVELDLDLTALARVHDPTVEPDTFDPE